MPDSVLVVDVGSGTQDVLVYEPGKNIENCPKFIVPSRTQIVAKKIRQATERGETIFLHGHLMGGGACGLALKKHLEAGLEAYATPEAARTFNDNLERVEAMGVKIRAEQPPEGVSIWMGDIDVESFRQALEAFGLTMPGQFAIALQDHGFSETESNRTLRFKLWEDFVRGEGRLSSLVYTNGIPQVYTRMHALRNILPNAVISDTGTAALLGILVDPVVKSHLETGVLAVNIGNSHTLAAAIKGDRVYGIFEQHTGILNVQTLQRLIERFQTCDLTNEDIFEDGGHGAFLHPEMRPGWEFVAVTGPRRSMAKALGWYEAAPFGDMMLTGCFGLLAGMDII